MKVLKTTEDVTSLIEKLKNIQHVSKFDDDFESEGERLGVSFHDMQNSFNKITQTLLPQLIAEEGEDSIYKILLDIGEELRHIQYHFHDMKFYRYLDEGD